MTDVIDGGDGTLYVEMPRVDFTRRFLRGAKEDSPPKPCSFNVRLILEHDERWAGKLAYCDFSYRILKIGLPPLHNAARGEWTNADTADLRHWVAENYGFEPKAADVDDALMVVSQSNRIHPVQEYLDGLQHDGVARLDFWLFNYLGAQDIPDTDGDKPPQSEVDRRIEYLKRAGVKWMISAVARVMEPPCKADLVLILEGDQGLGKSTALNVLFSDSWFTDSPFHLGDKDAFEIIRGRWGVELAELDAFNKAESTRAKLFFTSKVDRFRPHYARRAEDFPRQCVFAGSTNQDQYLRDPTGNRRYVPILCEGIDLEALRRDRDQLWAEAMARYQSGEKWWVTPEDRPFFEPEQESRFNEDVWLPDVQAWLNADVQLTKNHFTLADIFDGALQVDPAHMDQQKQNRLVGILKRLGWRKRRRGGRDSRVWGYERPPQKGPDAAEGQGGV